METIIWIGTYIILPWLIVDGIFLCLAGIRANNREAAEKRNRRRY